MQLLDDAQPQATATAARLLQVTRATMEEQWFAPGKLDALLPFVVVFLPDSGEPEQHYRAGTEREAAKLFEVFETLGGFPDWPFSSPPAAPGGRWR